MYNSLFSNIPFKRRITKPRESGVTVIIDRKLGLKAQEDFLDLTGDYVDIAKMMVGILALINAQTLRKKIDLYYQHEVGTPAWEQDIENVPERAGRRQDKEKAMERLRKLGYM